MTARARRLEDEQDIIGVRPTRAPEPLNFGLFAQPPEPPRAPSVADFAAAAAHSADGLKLLAVAERCAHAILDADRSVAVWQVRVALGQLGLLANDGTERLDALGKLGERMGLAAVDRERPPAWAQRVLATSHGNLGTVWSRPRDVATYEPAVRRARVQSPPRSETAA